MDQSFTTACRHRADGQQRDGPDLAVRPGDRDPAQPRRGGAVGARSGSVRARCLLSCCCGSPRLILPSSTASSSWRTAPQCPAASRPWASPFSRRLAADHANANAQPVRPLKAGAGAVARARAAGQCSRAGKCIIGAVLLARGDEIGPDAIVLEGPAVGGRYAGDGAEPTGALVGRTVAEVERHLVLDALRQRSAIAPVPRAPWGPGCARCATILANTAAAMCRSRRRAVAAATS